MKSRTLVLLGGSQQQIVAIEAAKACGYRTVLCDYLPDNPGQHHADAFYQVSTTDREAVVEVARREQAEGIIAYSSDPAAPTAAYVAESLGLPTNPLSSVEALSEKHLFREHLRKHGLPCPRGCTFSRNDSVEDVWRQIKDLDLPLVIKPTDSSGSKGISVIKTESELALAIQRAGEKSRNGILICEEYIERIFPDVIGGDIFVRDGKVEFWGLMSGFRDPRQSLIPIGERVPLALTDSQYENIKKVLQGLVTSLDIKFGELNTEVLLGKNDTPYVIELGGRAGGNMIPVQLSDISGIDLVRANVMCAMGDDSGDLSWDTQFDGDEAFMTYVLHSFSPGTFEGVSLSDEACAHCYRQNMYVELGSYVRPFDGADKALGILFFKFHNDARLASFIEEIDTHVRIKLA